MMVAALAIPDVLVGRNVDCLALDDLSRAVREGLSRSMVILGEPGIGKTRLLQYAAASAGNVRVITVIGMPAESQLGFAALHRLLIAFVGRIGRLPSPQADALRITLGLVEGAPPDRFLVGLGALTLLADVATDRPLVCLVDDVQWLDRESLEVLGFVARRLCADRIGLVFGVRDDSSALPALEGIPTRRLAALDPVSVREMISSNAAGPVHAQVADRIVRETAGNPLAIVELLGLLTPQQLAGRTTLPQRLPVGRAIEAHFLRRVKTLPPDTRSLLLLASAAQTDDPSALWRAAAILDVPPEAADALVGQDILSLHPQVEFRHPLIRSAVYDGAHPDNRRLVHLALASIADQDAYPDRAASHRAAATIAPEESVAADLERAAGRAEKRGGYSEQAAFLTRAAELTPDAQRRAVRFFAAARAHLAAGDGVLAEALLDTATPRLDAAGLHLQVQRLRAAIAVFFSRHKDAPALLLAAVAAADGRSRPLIREMLFEAMQAVLVARQFTTGTDPIAVARVALGVPREINGKPSVTDLLLDGFATRTAVGYAEAVPMLRDAVARLFTDETWGPGIPATILGWFAADDLWDDRGRLAMLRRAEVAERRHGALGALRVTLAGLTSSELWAARPAEAEARYLEAAEISAMIGVPRPASTGVLLELRAWQGREQESRDVARLTDEWGRERGAAVLSFFALFGLTLLELGLGRYPEALTWGIQIFQDDPPGFGNRILPEIVEAGVRSGETARPPRPALDRLADRAPASGTPWALGVLARSERCWPATSTLTRSTPRPWTSCPGLRCELACPRAPAVRRMAAAAEAAQRRPRRTAHRLRHVHSTAASAFASGTGVERRAAGDRVGPLDGTTRSRSHPAGGAGSRMAAAGATNVKIVHPSVRHQTSPSNTT